MNDIIVQFYIVCPQLKHLDKLMNKKNQYLLLVLLKCTSEMYNVLKNHVILLWTRTYVYILICM